MSTRLVGAGVQRRRSRTQLVAVALVGLLVVGCSASGADSLPAPTSTTATATAGRDYWPTAGWRTAAPSDQGIDPAALAQVDDQVAGAYPQVRSVLLVRHGYLVYEHYWHGLDRTSGQDIQSVTKSIIGGLVGIAIAEGKIKSLDQTVGELLRRHLPANEDPRLARVTVKQLLTMTSGLAGDDESLHGDPVVKAAMERSPDWVRHILSRRLEAEPGEHFAYSNASSHLLSAIVADTSGQTTLAYARAKLFNPLGIRTERIFQPVVSDHIAPEVVKAYEKASVAWPVDPQGYHLGYTGLRLPARDLAKFGFLYLNNGRWENKQLIPADYIAAATSSNGSSPNLNAGYGWHWWVVGEGDHRIFYARGYGGQFIYVAPDLDLVAVVTSDLETRGLDPLLFIQGTLVPAAKT